MKQVLIILVILLFIVTTGCSQRDREKTVGGPCEGCEAIFESGERVLDFADTLVDFENDPRKMEVSGTVYPEGWEDTLVLYIYHTNQEGVYPTHGNETGRGRRHGYLRGWIKTNESGKYKFFTCRPGAYPGRENPEHIHVIVKEPGYTAYYIDDFLFEDDPILTKEHRAYQRKRGGNGIIKLKKLTNGLWLAQRDIILGKNIPDYD